MSECVRSCFAVRLMLVLMLYIKEAKNHTNLKTGIL